MALEAAFQQLCTHLLVLHEACTNLRTTVREDKPLQDDVVLVDLFGDAADDLLGLLDEALVAATDGQRAVMYPLDLARVQHSLVTCQHRCQEVARRYWGDTFSYARLRELRRFGRRRGGEWRGWAASVKGALAACEEPLWAIDGDLFACWQELVERVGAHGMSIQAITIGQHNGTRDSYS